VANPSRILFLQSQQGRRFFKGISKYDRKLTITFLVRSQEEIMNVTFLFCLDLAVTFIQRLSLRNDPEVICLSVKLFFTSIHEQKIGQENITDEKDRATDKLLSELQQKVVADFYYQMADVHQREHLLKELQVRYPQFTSKREYVKSM